MRSVTFAVPGGLGLATGGSVYDRHVIAALRARGWHIDMLDWPDSFPFPAVDERRTVAASLAGLPDGTLTVIDGLAFGTLPELARLHAERLRLVALVHHPLSLETGLPAKTAARFAADEREALRWAKAVIVTSDATAATLAHDYAVPRELIAVARPGVERPRSGPFRALEGPVRIFSLGQVSPRKAYHVLVEALAGISDLAFSCVIAGSLERYPQCASALVEQIERAGLSDRIRMAGKITAEEVTRLYAEADLFALASVYEGYGMAIADALAWSLPVIATTGGAIPEVVPRTAGLLVPPGDTVALSGALRAVVGDRDLRALLAKGASEVADRLCSWDDTAQRIEEALDAS
jgi:glycosyltransferase involved in cell wall biosynthesis